MTIKSLIKKIIPDFLLRIYHFKLALLGAVIFGFPGYSKNLKIIGVTGTSGKSTTVDFITKIFNEAGERVASISSIRFKIADKEWENKYKMTMPGRFVIQKFLWQAKKAGCKYVILEITSEGIRQFRHKFINFDTAVFTNLTPEHIESHKGFENYRNEKLKLFTVSKNIHVINSDDKNSEYFLGMPAKKIIKFSIEDNKRYNLKLNVAGDFNLMNAIAATTVAEAYEIHLDIAQRAVEKAGTIPGRMEIVQKEPFEVVVDYAHTPEQLESVYKSFKDKKLICVLGSCGGGRDKWKRPVLGKIAGKYCKEVIITNEDPYEEDPLEIIEEVFKGVKNPTLSKNQYLILDRKEAIKKAVGLAGTGDSVIITGKGSEPWMCVAGGKKIPWSDKEIAREALQNK
jgi:UDP-N-acetylmuramoyl-L-alanyl-D-glutamate--2,6-diaminopimelate ligase